MATGNTIGAAIEKNDKHEPMTLDEFNSANEFFIKDGTGFKKVSKTDEDKYSPDTFFKEKIQQQDSGTIQEEQDSGLASTSGQESGPTNQAILDATKITKEVLKNLKEEGVFPTALTTGLAANPAASTTGSTDSSTTPLASNNKLTASTTNPAASTTNPAASTTNPAASTTNPADSTTNPADSTTNPADSSKGGPTGGRSRTKRKKSHKKGKSSKKVAKRRKSSSSSRRRRSSRKQNKH
jgi:hypothetical protein